MFSFSFELSMSMTSVLSRNLDSFLNPRQALSTPTPEHLEVETGKLLVKTQVRVDKPQARGDTTSQAKSTKLGWKENSLEETK